MDNSSFLPSVSSLFDQWQRDRSILRRRPLRRQWRRCMGIALMVNRFDHNAVAIGDRVFLPNHALTWMVLREIPAGYCPQFLDPHDVGGALATCTQATVSHGMPWIDFASRAATTWNFRYVPRDPVHAAPLPPHVLDVRFHHREFAVLNRVSSMMTWWHLGMPWMAMHHWAHLRRSLGGEIELDARLTNPREPSNRESGSHAKTDEPNQIKYSPLLSSVSLL